jgi:hypothetical protein
LQGSVEVHVGMKCGIRQKKLGWLTKELDFR